VATCLESFTAENAQFTQTSQQLQSKVTSLGWCREYVVPAVATGVPGCVDGGAQGGGPGVVRRRALLDKVVVDKAYAPLLHLLRNAVAHGIEDAAAREQRKKAGAGAGA